jgi:Mg2+/Co2+ transporter CorB
MDELSLIYLVLILVILVILSAYFSSSETAMMSLNRYRLKHLADRKYKGAKRVHQLLERPDRLIGLILLGNNFVNILAAMIVSLITLRIYGPDGLLFSSIVLTAIILVFAEVMPKTVAAIRPERVAFPSSIILKALMLIFYPLVWVLNKFSNGLLGIFGITNIKRSEDPLSREELRTVVKEAGGVIPHKHRQMLFGILDLENATVEDIMVPKSEMYGINLEDDWIIIRDQILSSRHTRLPCYKGNLSNVKGMLHLRRITKHVGSPDFDLHTILSALVPPYFVPAKTDLYMQLVNFQKERERIAFVVDEYGDLEGLVTLEDILEEVVGEFTTDPAAQIKDVVKVNDRTFIIDGSANIREINREHNLGLPEDGPKTLNGLILETLEDIPTPGTTFRLEHMIIEVMKTLERSVKSAKISIQQSPDIEEEAIAEDPE